MLEAEIYAAQDSLLDRIQQFGLARSCASRAALRGAQQPKLPAYVHSSMSNRSGPYFAASDY